MMTRLVTMPFQWLAGLGRRFARRDEGTMAIEVILTLPVFMFCTMGVYTYWDAFRSVNTAQKASYTVSDMISRETLPISEAYLTGLADVLQYMVGDEMPVEMRVTSISYSGVRERYEVNWSRSPYAKMQELDTDRLQGLVQYIPELADGDTITLVEARSHFTPAFKDSPAFFMYVGDEVFEQFIVTRPRFVPRICLEDVPCS